ncbi:MAG TPA: glycosyltransferase family 2 protein [Acidobacteriota bacterium]|jgi:glycosyltransferase involved in cell wall biosynthesis|nr:glycosyltransferase family 2 protein [Acidobacteriota bacterium]
MIDDKKVVVVLPAYNAARTLQATYNDIPFLVVDEVILVDDASSDETATLAKQLGIRTFIHPKNLGYGGNQKTCYREALRAGADIIVMVHPDYQYTPKLIGAMASMISSGEYDIVLGSRILGGRARAGGMPLYKYIANRFLTAFQNLLQRAKLSEYHTGFRAFTRRALETLPLEENSNDFVFDNQTLAQALVFGFRVGEISCPTRYFPEASSINFRRSVWYGLGVLKTALDVFCSRFGLAHPEYLSPQGKRLATSVQPQPNRRDAL